MSGDLDAARGKPNQNHTRSNTASQRPNQAFSERSVTLGQHRKFAPCLAHSHCGPSAVADTVKLTVGVLVANLRVHPEDLLGPGVDMLTR